MAASGETELAFKMSVVSGWPHLHGQIASQIHQVGRLVVTAYQVRAAAVPGAQALDGAFLALRREVFERVQFDERTFDAWHLYDLDFVFSAHLAGYWLKRWTGCKWIAEVHDPLILPGVAPRCGNTSDPGSGVANSETMSRWD
jgi:hypothetical protein